MKYMTFNSACAFAGVANMLSAFGVEVEDRDIALGMNLPYLFDRDDHAYLAGPMLQSAEWFNLYLNTIGYEMTEHFLKPEDVPGVLTGAKTAMLGIRVSPRDKHAVVYTGMTGNAFRFLNNKWQHTDDPEELVLSIEELLNKLDETVVVATIHTCPARTADFAPLFRHACSVLAELEEKLTEFCTEERTPEEIMGAMNTLFRPVLLDTITMLDLIEEEILSKKLRAVQAEYLTAIRLGKTVRLDDAIHLDNLLDALDEYRMLIGKQIC